MPWSVLQIAPTRDEREIRRAYAKALKSREHESDAAWFERLRAAYEEALHLCRSPSEGEETDIRLAPAVDTASDTATWSDAEQDEVGRQHARRLNEQLGLDRDEDIDAVLRHRIDMLEAAFQAGRDGLEQWQALAAYAPLHSLLYRDSFAPLIADLLARNWPVSRSVWTGARQFFHWEPPTTQDRSLGAHALRWLFEAAEQDAHEWNNLLAQCAQVTPDPTQVLRDKPWRRALRYFFEDRTRALMRSFISRIDALNAEFRLDAGSAEALAWWRRMFGSARPTSWSLWFGALVAFFCVCTGMGSWGLAAGAIAGVAGYMCVALPMHAWETRYQQQVMRTPRRRLAGPVLFAAGCVLTGFLPSRFAVLPSVLLVAGVAWVLLARYASIAASQPVGLGIVGKLFVAWAVAFFSGLVLATTVGPDAKMAFIAGAAAISAWVVYADGHAWALLKTDAPRLCALASPRIILAVSVLLLVCDVLVATGAPASRSLLTPLTLLWSMFGWSYARFDGFSFSGIPTLPFVILALLGSRVLPLLAGAGEFGDNFLLLLTPLLAIVAWQSGRAMTRQHEPNES